MREPEIYGATTFESFFQELKDEYKNEFDLEYFQSNHEGSLIDKIQEVGFDGVGVILNAGGYTHTSIALADCVSAIISPVIEVHISDIKKREAFRHHSFLEKVCQSSIMGKGLEGYRIAVNRLKDLL